MNLSQNFTLEELTHSDLAVRKGIKNDPDPDTLENLKTLASTLEQVREVLGTPILINSGYRCPKLNAAVGGSMTSAHVQGLAADFISPKFGTPREICLAVLKSGIPFDQIIQEGTWVHLSVDPRMRKQALTAHFANGKATYTQGIV